MAAAELHVFDKIFGLNMATLSAVLISSLRLFRSRLPKVLDVKMDSSSLPKYVNVMIF